MAKTKVEDTNLYSVIVRLKCKPDIIGYINFDDVDYDETSINSMIEDASEFVEFVFTQGIVLVKKEEIVSVLVKKATLYITNSLD